MVRTHTVLAGETLWALALRFYGDAELHRLITTASGIADPNVINVGQRLIVPDFTRYTAVAGDTLAALALRFYGDAELDWLIARASGIADPNAVKVALAEDGHALYFSRATIPYDRERTGGAVYRKHLGLYAYRRAALERFAVLPPHPLETTERLEQLRLLAHNVPIYVEQTPHTTIGVDTETDLDRVAAILAAR